MSLQPKETVQKLLISTTSRLVGEYEKDRILITHAWPSFSDTNIRERFSEGPVSRSAYIFAFETGPIDKKTTPLPDYSSSGDLICSYLAVLFGKRFDNHGLVEGIGFFHVPELFQFGQLCEHYLPFNSHNLRQDYPIPLNLAEISRIERLLLDSSIDAQFLRTFQGASKFYLQAIQAAEHDPEVAYLHLITSGEILSNFFKYKKQQLLDNQTKEALTKIKVGLTDGEKVAKFISGRLSIIKKQFVETVIKLVDLDFFNLSESGYPFGRFKSNSFMDNIAAAYDLRSSYVHSGFPFGQLVLPLGGMNNEIQVGIRVVPDKKLAKTINKAPTLIGLERVIRYCLLQFAKAHGVYIEPNTVTTTRDQQDLQGDASAARPTA
jgi:hypothetical protein